MEISPTIDRPAEAPNPPLAGIVQRFSEHARPLPWRQTRDVYAVWVSEVMSAQTTVSRAAAAGTGWMGRWPTVDTLADASLADVLGQWQGLGYPRRARDLHRSAGIVVASGRPDDLTELPGVGPYVAAAIRCFALEQSALPLDVNVRRVLTRRFPAGVDITGDPWRGGQALMEFGQRVCTARPRANSARCGQGARAPLTCRQAAWAAASHGLRAACASAAGSCCGPSWRRAECRPVAPTARQPRGSSPMACSPRPAVGCVRPGDARRGAGPLQALGRARLVGGHQVRA